MRCEHHSHRPSFLGVSSFTPVDPQHTVEIVSRSDLDFHIERIYVLAACLEFVLYDIRVGANSQFVGATGAEPVETEPFGLGPEGRLLRHVREVIDQALEVRGDEARTNLGARELPNGLDAEIEQLGRPAKLRDPLRAGQALRTIVRNRGNDPCVFRAVYFGQIGDG